VLQYKWFLQKSRERERKTRITISTVTRKFWMRSCCFGRNYNISTVASSSVPGVNVPAWRYYATLTERT
jgi:hypothetical protein